MRLMIPFEEGLPWLIIFFCYGIYQGMESLEEYDLYIKERAEEKGKVVNGEWVDLKLKYIATGKK